MIPPYLRVLVIEYLAALRGPGSSDDEWAALISAVRHPDDDDEAAELRAVDLCEAIRREPTETQ